MKNTIYKFSADVVFAYNIFSADAQQNLNFTMTADICRDSFSDAVATFKTYVGNVAHDAIALSIPDLVEKRVEGILSTSYECEQEGYSDADTDTVCVDSERIHYSWEAHHDVISESNRMATNIKWDTDGEKVNLPNQMTIPDDVDDDVDAIGDYLSDETGFCHFGFDLVYEATVKVNREDARVIHNLLSGKDLDWDADETHSVNAKFHNGTNVDVMLCCPPETHANYPNGSPWTQACWYDADGHSIGCSVTDDKFFGDWTMTDDDDPALSGPVSYVVHVVMEQEWTEADNIYLVDVGIIVDKDKYPACYSDVYDKQRGYYDEDRYLLRGLEKAKAEAKQYVIDGVENTYAIVTNQGPLDIDDIEVDDACVSYDAENVVYSAVKKNGEVVESFVEPQKALYPKK